MKSPSLLIDPLRDHDVSRLADEALIDKTSGDIAKFNAPRCASTRLGTWNRNERSSSGIVLYVARHGGITEAVRNIPYGIQQPAVSGQVAQLEEYLGVTLFQRRPFKLTPLL